MNDLIERSAHALRVLALGALALLFAEGPLAAQKPATPSDDVLTSGNAYLTTFPEGDVYKAQVYGDSFAEGLLDGLIELLANDSRISVAKKHKPIGPLIRWEWEDELKPEETSREVVHIGVIMLGLADRQIIRLGQGVRPLQIGSPDWQAEYGRRLDRWLKALKKRNIALYLVGQPVLRRPDSQRDAEMLNEIMREKAYLNGVRFIDVMEAFQDESGAFSQFGPDISGNRQKMRDGDGVSFTSAGNRKLAHFVEREIKRDVTQAATDRTIPLAGAEPEQRRINPSKTVGSPITTGWKGSVTVGGGTPKRGAQQAALTAPPIPDGIVDQKADNGRLTLKTITATGREEAITIDIVRPAIPAAMISLLARREAADRTSQPGEAIIEDLGNGMTLVNSVSALGDQAATGQKRRSSPSQTPYFTVSVKGERLPPKPGRADDFTWPRNEAELPPAPAAAPAPTQVKAPAPASGQRQPAPQQRPSPRG